MRAIRDPAEREGVILAASSRTYTEQRLREESPFPAGFETTTIIRVTG
jgi:hypothetical protein